MRRAWPVLAFAALLAIDGTPTTAVVPGQAAAFELDEITIAQLQAGLAAGRYTSRQLVESYLKRIDAIDRGGPARSSPAEAPDMSVERPIRSARRSAH
jgi:hypothetical protein